MKKRLLVLAIASTFAAQAAASDIRRVDNPIAGQYIVVLKDDASISAAGGQRGRGMDKVVDLAVEHDVPVDLVYEQALQGFVTRGNEATMRRLARDPRVAFVEEDGMSYPNPTQSNATWGLDRVDQRDLPLNGTYYYSTGASNVRIYIIDSGIRSTHVDFGGRVLAGATGVSDGRGTEDCNGHGTHVAGTSAGATWGVAKQSRLVPVRVFGCTGGASNSLIASAIDWVRTNHVKPAVTNMSLGGPANSTIDNATNNLINAGVTVVVAAGNDNQSACNFSPARVSNAMTVGSTTSTDARSSFSNFGTCVNIFAPGSSIRSAWYTSDTATNTISGTSMASPHVAGAAALVLAGTPSASPSTVRSTIYNKATTGRLTSIGSGSPNRLLYTR